MLLLLALLTSPLVCCGTIQLLEALPGAWLPPPLDFVVNIFEAQARVENRTTHTLYLTPVTTTAGRPAVIAQNIAFRQRDIPVAPGRAVVFTYDSADLPLAGFAVCRTDADCRLLTADHADAYVVEAYDQLPGLEPSWQQAIQSHPRSNYSSVLIPALSLVPVLLWSGWLYLGRLERRRAS